MKSDLPQDVQLWLIGFCIISALFLMSLIRIFLLSRSNRRMRADCARMEKQAALQHIEITAIHHDAMSWRAKTQWQFDALRSDLTHRVKQADQGGAHVLQDLDKTHQEALAAARAQITTLEAALSSPPETAVEGATALPKPDASALPALPAMETLRIQALEAELATIKEETASGVQQNATLQRALLLARRRRVPAMRKNPARNGVRNA
jgi:hypothetical protein